MKFSIAALITGAVLILAPFISHAYDTYRLSVAVATIAGTAGSLSLPELSPVWYGVSCVAGAATIVAAFFSEHRKAGGRDGM
jgi:hypothetical protein